MTNSCDAFSILSIRTMLVFRQFSARAVANVARRCADESRDRVFLQAFRARAASLTFCNTVVVMTSLGAAYLNDVGENT